MLHHKNPAIAGLAALIGANPDVAEQLGLTGAIGPMPSMAEGITESASHIRGIVTHLQAFAKWSESARDHLADCMHLTDKCAKQDAQKILDVANGIDECFPGPDPDSDEPDCRHRDNLFLAHMVKILAGESVKIADQIIEIETAHCDGRYDEADRLRRQYLQTAFV